MSEVLRVGIPNRGRLHTCCTELAEEVFGLVNYHPRRLRLQTRRSDVELICARSTDIPKLMDEGILHIGITGNDYVTEASASQALQEIADLGFCPGQICLLVAEDDPARELSNLPSDVAVVSQYPRHARLLLPPLFPDMHLRVIDGAAEVYPMLGLGRAIMDIVATGETAECNKLRMLASFGATSARLYRSRDLPSSLEAVADDVCTRVAAATLAVAHV